MGKESLVFIYRLVYNKTMESTNSKNTILMTAMELFSQKGFDHVGVNEIVQKAGVTKPTLYYFFDSKEGVFQAILEKYYKSFNCLIESVSHYDPHIKDYYRDVYPVLIKITETYYTYARENREFYLLLLSLTCSPPTSTAALLATPYLEEQFDIIKDFFTAVSRVHGNLAGKEFQYAGSLIAMINATIILWYKDKAILDLQAARGIVHQFMHGMYA